ncbi:MAG: S1 RNA-binding domain-containing protein [Spirochaetes bacterium]|jgi:uncharacterized protein|nr:S1 RNA-binding domain-containing protein [Spirochaetota bacterium]
MTRSHLSICAHELGLRESHIAGAAALFEESAGIPFIARYRKERTGSMDEELLLRLRDRLQELAEVDARRSAILRSLEERELLTDDLRASLNAAQTKSRLEDIYLPFRPKRKTRASRARERGLEPLAERLLSAPGLNPEREAQAHINADGGLPDTEAALAGARDIIAEWISEDATLRGELRELFAARAELQSRRAAPPRGAAGKGGASNGASDHSQVYRDYFDRREAAGRAPSHRVLAMFRGGRESVLTVHVLPPEERALRLVEARFKGNSPSAAQAEQLFRARQDGYKRLLAPSLENEAKARLKRNADETAAAVFAENLRELLLAAPLGGKPVLAVDPGFRTGCKVVCLDARGELLHHEAIYPLEPHNKRSDAAQRVGTLIGDYAVEVIAVGNGTGGREAEAFLREIAAPAGVSVISVNEAGASVYSASLVAREEFPNHDVTVRGAVSIGRRLMDPLAELVKIDPKSIGVGQYQHDVDQKLLEARLVDTVVSCVNAVGVDLNTASSHLLRYVSGISQKLARAIVGHRAEKGGFTSRAELKAVPGLGDKTFEQAAGFLRVRSAGGGGEQRGGGTAPPQSTAGAHPLDASGVHPERYGLVERMAQDAGVEVGRLIGDEALCDSIDLNGYVDDQTGLATLRDIVAELKQPGRDPRPRFEEFAFSEEVHEIDDLRPGMKLPGVVTNVTNFGAFVDIGVHRDGLVHISKLADHFVSDPHEVVRIHQTLTVTVVDVDTERKRISLSLVK